MARTPIYGLRLDPETKARWNEAATVEGVDLAEHIRRCVEGMAQLKASVTRGVSFAELYGRLNGPPEAAGTSAAGVDGADSLKVSLHEPVGERQGRQPAGKVRGGGHGAQGEPATGARRRMKHPSPRAATCEHRVPAGSFCKTCDQ